MKPKLKYVGSNFKYKNGDSGWGEHFGVKINFGFWI